LADELVDICDENGKPLGIKKMKSEAHEQGLWHRGVNVWIYGTRGILLQLRSKNKALWPNKWDVAVGGHIKSGESPIGTVIREMNEEIGINVRESDLEFVLIKKSGSTHRAHDLVYLYRFDDGEDLFKLQKDEVEKVRFFGIGELEKDMKLHPSNYVIDTKEYWIEIIGIIKQKLKVR
jgi:isopentenyldiphosphate isomerase